MNPIDMDTDLERAIARERHFFWWICVPVIAACLLANVLVLIAKIVCAHGC